MNKRKEEKKIMAQRRENTGSLSLLFSSLQCSHALDRAVDVTFEINHILVLSFITEFFKKRYLTSLICFFFLTTKW